MNFYSTVSHIVNGGWGKEGIPCRECEKKELLIKSFENNLKSKAQQAKKLITRVTKIAKEKAIMKKKTIRMEKQSNQKIKQVAFLRNHNETNSEGKDDKINRLQQELDDKNLEIANSHGLVADLQKKYKTLEKM